jgi:hypothetical protein
MVKVNDKTPLPKNDDAIWGAASIGAVIGRTPRQTHYMLNRGCLPAKRMGGCYVGDTLRGARWVASRKALLAAVGLEQ